MTVFHGGDLADASARFGDPAKGWVDLSTGINPWPWPVDSGRLADLHRLPERDDLDQLRAAAASAYGIGDPDRIVLAPGTQALIQWLPRLRPPEKVSVLAPTYGEHAPAWRQAGHSVEEVSVLPAANDQNVVVLTRPNNPDGAIYTKAYLNPLAAELHRREGWLVIDEAFADLDPRSSIAAQIDSGLIAFRSFGKFYGLPGLRLGFAIADAGTATLLAAALGPWPVSTLAAKVGVEALLDTGWQTDTRKRLAVSRERLDDLLLGAAIEIIGGTDLFRLAQSDTAAEIFDRLGRNGLYVRRFPENDRWLRFGLPGSEEHWDRLEAALLS